jgi:muramoyltetrapeptide carboxypeptidase LdcA involved in peptidoglycan recycling
MLKNLTKPKALAPGDTVAIISLSWGAAALYPARYEAGLTELETQFGVRTVSYPSTHMMPEDLRANPKLRAKDLMDAFKDPSIAAIITSIGGGDTIRLLPYIDFDVIRNNPKIFLGYSDTTVNHFMCLKAGLTSFYGPSIMLGFAENGGMREYEKASVRQMLMSPTTPGTILPSHEWSGEYEPSWEDPNSQSTKRKTRPTSWHYIQGAAVARGRLLGGCLESLKDVADSALFPAQEDFDGAILFLETSEARSAAKAMHEFLHDYGKRGILARISGMIWGRPEGVHNKKELATYDDTIRTVLHEYARADMPVITGMDFGHTDPMFVVPYGALAEINPLRKTFTVLESAVVE